MKPGNRRGRKSSVKQPPKKAETPAAAGLPSSASQAPTPAATPLRYWYLFGWAFLVPALMGRGLVSKAIQESVTETSVSYDYAYWAWPVLLLVSLPPTVSGGRLLAFAIREKFRDAGIMAGVLGPVFLLFGFVIGICVSVCEVAGSRITVTADGFENQTCLFFHTSTQVIRFADLDAIQLLIHFDRKGHPSYSLRMRRKDRTLESLTLEPHSRLARPQIEKQAAARGVTILETQRE